MSLPKLFLAVSVALFVVIGSLALIKRSGSEKKSSPPPVKEEVDLVLLTPRSKIQQVQMAPQQTELPSPSLTTVQPVEERPVVIEHDVEPEGLSSLFSKGSGCPIVETIAYKSHVSWKRHRPAWLIDYANYYKTPLDFIYRSLNGSMSGNPCPVSEGMQFNVFRKDFDFRFHVVVSLSSCRVRLYYVIPQERRVVFLKSYQVCVGRKDSSRASGYLTPVGLYELGSRVAAFRPRMMGTYKGRQVELMQVFGSHWIPFEKEIDGCSEPAKGYGIHGTPMSRQSADGELEEDDSSIGHYESDGCIRLAGKDIKELFSVISTRRTFVEIVPSFQQSKLLRGEI